jgi:hypothetical protein
MMVPSVATTSQGFSQTLTTTWQIGWGPPGTQPSEASEGYTYDIRTLDPSEGRKLKTASLYVYATHNCNIIYVLSYCRLRITSTVSTYLQYMAPSLVKKPVNAKGIILP